MFVVNRPNGSVRTGRPLYESKKKQLINEIHEGFNTKVYFYLQKG